MDIISKYGYNIIANPHVNRFNLHTIFPECYRSPKSKIRSSQTLTPFKINLMFPLIKTELNTDRFKQHCRFENMSNAQIQFMLKMIPIDQVMDSTYIYNVKYKKSFRRSF
jgi:hypothetical protein